jgi:hypothetical protein
MRRNRRARVALRSPDTLEDRRLLTTLIALIDSGVDLSSAADLPYYNFTWAYDAVSGQTVAQVGEQRVQDTSLQHGHGASVADFIIQGIKAAEAQPGAGQAQVQIVPIRDTTSGLNVDNNALIRGVYWAADHGAAVINLSVSYHSDPVLNDPSDPHNGASLSQAIEYAQTKGAVVVTGSGNESMNIDHLVVYPPYATDSFYSTSSPVPSNLIVAAAVDSSGNLGRLSNWGPAHVSLGAPADSTGATSYSSGYTAGVAGVIAALLSPGYTPQQLIDVIESTVTPQAQSVGAWSATGGIINPAGAVALVMSQGVTVNAGGGGPSGQGGDGDFSGGTVYTTAAAIDTSQLGTSSPQSTFQSERYGNFTYTIPNLLPNQPYIVTLDFAEIYWDAPGERLFNVLINGDPVLTNFDIYATAGGKDRAIDRQFECSTGDNGEIVVKFVTLKDNAKVSGIQVTPAPDLARGKPATSSTIEGDGYSPAMAFDGNASTRWSSGQWLQDTNIGWLSVDLGAPYHIAEIRLDWERAYAVDYQIQVSLDGSNWVAIKTVSGNKSDGPADFTGLAGLGRYVRIYCTQVSQGSDNFSLYSVQVYGTAVTDLALGRPAASSSNESSYYAPGMAFDGNASTRWSSGQWLQDTNIGWLSVDLGAPYHISEIKLDWERAYAVDYQIQVSLDGSNWVAIKTVSGNKSDGPFDFSDLSGVGRYVRIYCTQVSQGSNNFSLYSVRIYGTPATVSSLAMEPAGTLSVVSTSSLPHEFASGPSAISTPTPAASANDPPAATPVSTSVASGGARHLAARRPPHRSMAVHRPPVVRGVRWFRGKTRG